MPWLKLMQFSSFQQTNHRIKGLAWVPYSKRLHARQMFSVPSLWWWAVFPLTLPIIWRSCLEMTFKVYLAAIADCLKSHDISKISFQTNYWTNKDYEAYSHTNQDQYKQGTAEIDPKDILVIRIIEHKW